MKYKGQYKPQNLSLAELSRLYVENKGEFEKIRSLIVENNKTFRDLTLVELRDLYNTHGEKTFEYYKNNPELEIMELKKPYHPKLSVEEMRSNLELERLRIEVAKLRSELGMEKDEQSEESNGGEKE